MPLRERDAHLVTVNDYLARRDAEWMAPVFNHLGLSVGLFKTHCLTVSVKMSISPTLCTQQIMSLVLTIYVII